jgi:transcriptional regulator with XRE-family HTH domain
MIMTNPNVRLREEREKRGWTQRFVAGKVGTSAFTVGRWERGVEMTSRHFQHSLCELFGLDAVTLGFVHEGSVVHDAVPPTSLTTLWHVPYDRNPFFTDHRQLLNLLHTRLMADEKGASRQAISGLGGIGKTQLALEYAYTYRDHYTAIFWVNSETLSDIVSIGKILRVAEAQKHKPRQQLLFKEVMQWLSC